MKCLYKVRLPFPSPASARREHCTAGSLLHARALVTVDLRCLAACSRTPCAGCPQTGPLVLSRTTFAAPPPPHEAEHHRPQQRALADVHRYRDFAANLCRIGRSPTERQLHHSAHQSLPPSKASSARAPRPLALAGARCHHILAPPSAATRTEIALDAIAARDEIPCIGLHSAPDCGLRNSHPVQPR
jgi:hypothetical protein